jgi:hypothetical protein
MRNIKMMKYNNLENLLFHATAEAIRYQLHIPVKVLCDL